MSWTTERVEHLKKLWSEGHSASQIAAELGGITRNAVIGKVHRLGLSGRTKATPAPSKTRRSKTPDTSSAEAPEQNTASQLQTEGATALKAAPEPAPQAEAKTEPLAELVPISKRASIMTLTERTCKWPIGDPSTDEFYFCGRGSEPGTPYCAHHCRVAYQPVSDRRRERRQEVRAAG
ncbi:GcrA family cell cycle regulator [Roseibium sp. RKSG952]|uniref:GcrA family cell cycle regulator n=1 Tax=Roseibium sp. RKSG952 TaxID=2529384 RepID=UPI0012BC168D|nr:GcrA family cell cycle regulator [Roseibium sp. RKSG952]MTH96505.1 GcrA cell cycle regulator [Roseibium sp. RKSG952]